MQRFLNELSTMLVGPGERRFARELGRLLGLRIAEPESGQQPKSEPVKHDCTNEPKKEV
jgi:hypothetical protein